MRLLDNTRLLVQLLWRPAAAMSGVLDRGSLLFASLAVLAVSLLIQLNVVPRFPAAVEVVQQPQVAEEGADLPRVPVRVPARWSFRFYTPLLVLALVYVPGTLLIANLVARLGAFGAVFERDYSPLLTCTAMAWAAVHLPVVLAAGLLPFPALAALLAAAYAYLAVLQFFAIRTVFGTGNGVAAVAVGLSGIPLAAAMFFWAPLRSILGWLASPFFLFYTFYYLRGEFSGLTAGLRRRQHFRRTLEVAAINPHDAEAQYQLGLIYQQRRQYHAAIERFRNAIAIDPGETDAHFQLGRIAREQGRLGDALTHFQTVLDQDDKHSLSEILREIGAVYLAAHRYEDAQRELAAYVERRPYDAEGLFYLGRASEHLGGTAEARELYARAIESARTAPRYLRLQTARWSRLAQKQLRRLGRAA